MFHKPSNIYSSVLESILVSLITQLVKICLPFPTLPSQANWSVRKNWCKIRIQRRDTGGHKSKQRKGENFYWNREIHFVHKYPEFSLSMHFPIHYCTIINSRRQGSNACTIAAVELRAYFSTHKLKDSLFWNSFQLYIHMYMGKVQYTGISLNTLFQRYYLSQNTFRTKRIKLH